MLDCRERFEARPVAELDVQLRRLPVYSTVFAVMGGFVIYLAGAGPGGRWRDGARRAAELITTVARMPAPVLLRA